MSASRQIAWGMLYNGYGVMKETKGKKDYASELRDRLMKMVTPGAAAASTKQAADSPGARLASIQEFAEKLARK